MLACYPVTLREAPCFSTCVRNQATFRQFNEMKVMLSTEWKNAPSCGFSRPAVPELLFVSICALVATIASQAAAPWVVCLKRREHLFARRLGG